MMEICDGNILCIVIVEVDDPNGNAVMEIFVYSYNGSG